MSQIPSFDLPLPDLGPRPGAARKAAPDADEAEAGHSFRRLLERHTEAARAEEGKADEPPRPEAPSDQDADEASDDPSPALAAVPSATKDVGGEQPVLPAAPLSQAMQAAEIKADTASVAILPLGTAAGLPPQQAAVAAALFGGTTPRTVAGPNAAPIGDAVNQQPSIQGAPQAPAPTLPTATAALTQHPATGATPELAGAAAASIGAKPAAAATPATAAANGGSKALADLLNQSPITVVAAPAAPPAKAASSDTGAAPPAKPVLPEAPQLSKKEADAVLSLADADAAQSQSGAPATSSFDGFTTTGPLTDSPRTVANHYNRVGDSVHRALSDGTMTPADQVSLRLLHGISEGKRTIQVQLHPAELGSIDVKMHWQGDRLTAQFVVDRPETLDLLQRDARALERALGGVGIELSDSGLSFSLRDQGGWQQQERVPGAMTGDTSSVGELQETAADEPLGQIVRDGIISIRV
jgi:flagellar hook-length control protein FliK